LSQVLEEVVVTAQKREETLQSAAISVTAVQAEDIDGLAINDPRDLQSQLPAVQFMTTGLTSTTIRGVGTFNNQPNVDAAVAWNVDGTYISHHMAVPPLLFDIDRIEVVRGPLGTLYGKNSNGGSINVVTARPVLGEWRARAQVGTGNYDQLDTEFMLNIPLADGVALRLSAANDYSDGYFEDGSEGTDNYAARARLLVEPSDRFNLLATVDWSDVDHSGIGFAYCPPQAVAQVAPVCDGVKWMPYQGFGMPGNFQMYGTDGPIGENPGYVKRENLGAYVELNYKWDSATLTSISNWHRYDREEQNTWDLSSNSPKHYNAYVTQELRVASAADSSIDWVAGLLYAREKSEAVERFGTTTGAFHEIFVPVSSYGIEGGVVTSAAAFGEVTVPISERVSLKGGLRYTDETKKLPGTARAGLNTPNPIIVQTGDTLKNGKVTWLVGAEYEISDENMVYAKVNTGFKSGTVNAVPPDIGVPTVTTPEEITAYQIGSKNRFLDNRLEVNTELFYYDYEGYQVVVIATDPTGFFPGQFFPSANAQKAKFKGAEVETHYAVSDSGQLDLAVTLLDAKHTKFVTSAFDYSGNDVQRAPPYTIMAGYSHAVPFSDGSVLHGRLNTQITAGAYTLDSNVPGSYQGGYTTTSAFLTYTRPDQRWSMTGWVRNLENRAVISVAQGGSGRGGWNVYTYAPRMYGVSIKYEM